MSLISPASAPRSLALLRRGQRHLEKAGYRVVLGKHSGQRLGYLAGSDPERYSDLLQALRDPASHAVFCTRGGYGVSRLLEHLKPGDLPSQPKIFVGFSDITLLHLALQKAGWVSFWGPMPATSLGLTPDSLKYLRQALGSPQPLGRIRLSGPTVRSGQAEGPLTGGTLTLLAASLGTPYAVETKGRIVFLEDDGEEPYRVDRLLTQLLAAGRLRDAAGIVLGHFTDSRPKSRSLGTSVTLRKIFLDRLRPLNLPVATGLPIGHVPDQVTLPYGVRARLDSARRSLVVLEPGVL